MAALKHVGRVAANQKKVGVVYRTVPGEAESCLVVLTETLNAEEHDSFMKVIESNAGQTAIELADAMNRATLPDGRNMFQCFHKFGKIQKMASKLIEMTPDMQSNVNLAELNQLIANQKGITIHELAGGKQPEPTQPASDVYTSESTAQEYADTGVLSDDHLAAQYRSQADALFKEAKALREQAEELVPTKRKTKKTEESAKA